MGEYQGGKSTAQITTVDIYTNPDFIAATPGLKERIANGHPAMNVADYLSYKDQVQAMAKVADFPPGFVSDQEIGAMVAGNVSASEISGRINDAFLAGQNASPQTKQAMQDFYHVGPGGLAAFFLDPTKAEPLLHQQVTAAQIAGFGTAAGASEISSADANAFAMAATSEQAKNAAAAAQGALSVTRGNGATATEAELLAAQLGVAPSTESLEKAGQHVQTAVGQQVAAFRGGGTVQGAGQVGPNGAGSGTQ
jgi:hypothetical protein